jgi:putative ATP-binding cassette transporter
MDEATSTLDLQNETLCMQRVLDEEIALLTIAHRPSVVRYHQLMITMDMDGNFTSTPLIDMTPC